MLELNIAYKNLFPFLNKNFSSWENSEFEAHMLSKFGELDTSLLSPIPLNLEKIQLYTSNDFPGETQQDICLSRRISLHLTDCWTTSSFLTTHPVVIETTLSITGLCWPWWLLFGVLGIPPDQDLVHLLRLSWPQWPRDKPTLAWLQGQVLLWGHSSRKNKYLRLYPHKWMHLSRKSQYNLTKKPHVPLDFIMYWYCVVTISGAEQPWLVKHTWTNSVQWPHSQNKHIARSHRATLSQTGEPQLTKLSRSD